MLAEFLGNLIIKAIPWIIPAWLLASWLVNFDSPKGKKSTKGDKEEKPKAKPKQEESISTIDQSNTEG